MDVRIRKASPDDAYLISSTRKIVWEETYRGIYSDVKLDEYRICDYERRDRKYLEQPDQHYFLFLEHDLCVGYFSYGPYHYGSYKDFELCINHLYITKRYQGNGLGKRAFDQILEYCRDHQIQKFFCGCNANNLPAISFYRHMGGIQADSAESGLPKEDQIIHFEFYLGE